MIKQRLNPQCITCLLDKNLKSIPESFSKLQKTEYMQGVLKIIGNADIALSAPEIVEQLTEFKLKFGEANNFSGIKSHFNKLLLSFETEIESKIKSCQNPLKAAVKYAMAGNFIDFGAMNSVDEEKLRTMLNNSGEIAIDEELFDKFESEIIKAEDIVYLTDNCGEIVLDKLLIKQILKINNNVKISVIVRGKPVLNDCTIEDAKQVGMDEIVSVTDNGTAIAGTALNKISNEAKNIIDNADLIISKGQGNFETLHNSGKNIYYLFLCKCKMFAERFGVNQMTGIFIDDKNL